MKRGIRFLVLISTTLSIATSACSSKFDQSAEQTALVQTLGAQIAQARLATMAAQTQAAVPTAVTSGPTETFTEIPSVTTELPPLPEVDNISCIPTGTKRELVQVVDVVDGDSIEVEINGQVSRCAILALIHLSVVRHSANKQPAPTNFW